MTNIFIDDIRLTVSSISTVQEYSIFRYTFECVLSLDDMHKFVNLVGTDATIYINSEMYIVYIESITNMSYSNISSELSIDLKLILKEKLGSKTYEQLNLEKLMKLI